MACTTKNRSDRDRQFRSLQHGFRNLKHKTRENNLTPENAEPIVKELKTELGNLLQEDGSKERGQRIFDFELFDKEKHQSKLIETINSLESQLNGVESELGQMKNVEKEDKKYIATLDSQLKQKDRDMSDLKDKIKQRESDYKRIEKEDKDYINSLLSQLSQRDEAISELKDEEKRLEEKITQLVEINDSDRKRCEELKGELNTLEKEITRKDETIDDLQKGNRGLIAKREELSAEIETMKSIEKRLEKEKKELQHHVKKMTDENKRQEEEFARAYENLNHQITHLSRSLEEQRRTIDKLQKNLSEEKKAKENALNRLSAAAANRLRDQNPGITDLSDPNRPLKLAEKVSELYDNEWTNAMENLESELDIEEEKGIKILLKIIREVFDACTEFGDSHLQSFPDMLILPAYFVHKEKDRMVNVKDLPSEMLKPMKDFRKSHAKHAINHLQKFFATDEGKSKLQIKKKVFKTCEEYINKCIELCWMMRIQDPPIYMETEYPTNSDFDSNKMRSYTKAGKFIHFVVWPTFFLHKDGPLLAKGVVQGSKIEIKDGKEISSDEECSSSNADSDVEEFTDARSRTDSQPGDNLKKTTSQDEVRDIPEPNQLGNKEISQEGDHGDGASDDGTNDTTGGTYGTIDIPEEQNNTDDKPGERNNIDNKPKETNNTDDKPEANNDTHINQSKPPGSEANDEKKAANSDDTNGKDGGERAAEQKDDDETQS
ncbi:ERC protein 2-like [Saccostrea cucullata]|uniref:ERC protein 2-like n=1 Tax=Saccostrea cuccullata TaxID=36930 RepID=UPI002ED67E5C